MTCFRCLAEPGGVDAGDKIAAESRRGCFGFRFQRLPALEFVHEQLFDFRAAGLVGAEGVRRLAIVVGLAHSSRESGLLGLEGGDFAREGGELARFLEGQLAG